MDDIMIRPAEPDEYGDIIGLLGRNGLPTADIAQGRPFFLLALIGGKIAGCAGLEGSGSTGLLRSLAVEPGFRSGGVGSALYAGILERARGESMDELYLLTTEAEAYFSGKGFKRIERSQVPDAIASTREFRSLCPSTAICMRFALR
jgi:amino-acid N-acetyltransferase